MSTAPAVGLSGLLRSARGSAETPGHPGWPASPVRRLCTRKRLRLCGFPPSASTAFCGALASRCRGQSQVTPGGVPRIQAP